MTRGEEANHGRSTGRGRGQEARGADAVRHREEPVARALAWMGEAGLVEDEVRERLWRRWQEGDPATRGFLSEQVERVLNSGELDRKGGPDGGRRDPESVDPVELEVLRQLSLPEVDVEQVAQHVRRFDPMRFLGDPEDPGAVMRFLSGVPLTVHRVQRRLVWSGGLLLFFAVALLAASVLFPVIVPWVGLAGVVFGVVVVGILLVRTGGWVGRSAKDQGIDLAVYARLPEDERRLLLVRRVGLRLLDPKRLAGIMERGGRDPDDSPRAEEEDGLPADEFDPGPDEEDVLGAQEPVSAVPERGDPGGPDSDSGRWARWLSTAAQAVQQAARSEPAKRVGQELSGRARSAGRSARDGLQPLRERGEPKGGHEGSDAGPEEARDGPQAESSQRATRSPAKRSRKRASRTPQPSRTAKPAGGSRKSAAKPSPKRSTKTSTKRPTKAAGAKKGAASKGSREPGGKKRAGSGNSGGTNSRGASGGRKVARSTGGKKSGEKRSRSR